MSGGPDPLYIAARRTLLDALEVMKDHLDAVILVGAQAVYLHTGAGELAVDPYTTDADLALDPTLLGPEPLIEELLGEAGFSRSPNDVGAWGKPMVVEGVSRPMVVDLLVPEAVGGAGRRGARIPPHDKRTARKVFGLEGVLVDRELHRIGSLEPEDDREFEVSVAGPGALLVSKMVKIGERSNQPGRRSDKDALDVLRLLQAVSTDDLARRLDSLYEKEVSGSVVTLAVENLAKMFETLRSTGCLMAARAAAPLESEEVVAASAVALSHDLVKALKRLRE